MESFIPDLLILLNLITPAGLKGCAVLLARETHARSRKRV